MKHLLAILIVAAFSGCATDPNTGKTYWDATATFRAIGAAVGALQSPETVQTHSVP